MTPWEEVRSEPNTIPRRATPLPWLLLAVSLCLTVGGVVLGRLRVNEERARTALALKDNDVVMAKLKDADKAASLQREAMEAAEATSAELNRRIVELELQVQRQQAELEEAKAAAKAAPRGRR